MLCYPHVHPNSPPHCTHPIPLPHPLTPPLPLIPPLPRCHCCYQQKPLGGLGGSHGIRSHVECTLLLHQFKYWSVLVYLGRLGRGVLTVCRCILSILLNTNTHRINPLYQPLHPHTLSTHSFHPSINPSTHPSTHPTNPPYQPLHPYHTIGAYLSGRSSHRSGMQRRD